MPEKHPIHAKYPELQKTPVSKRSIEEYNKLIEKFRRVYLTDPTYGLIAF